MRSWETYPTKIASQYRFGVVLTGMVNQQVKVKGQFHFNESVDRITEACRLFQNGVIQTIIITGGSGTLGENELRESPVLKTFLSQMGIPDSAIIIENQSRNTYENAKLTKPIVGNERILMITSAFHQRRASACFLKQQIQFDPYPVDFRSERVRLTWDQLTPSVMAIKGWDIIFKEMLGYVAYWIVDYL
ncbi:MAG: YdcF family protein [Cyclobacteriaceae bacterium]|nr:YdcF family protein [Cyclobacteriaceae bacterium HetDA_MAG_MS6]